MDTQDLIGQIENAATKFVTERYKSVNSRSDLWNVVNSAMLEGALIYAKLDKEDCQIDLQLLKASMQ